MAEIVNLRQARKRKARDGETRQADQNRALHGRTLAEKRLDAASADQAKRFVDGHRREPASDDTP